MVAFALRFDSGTWMDFTTSRGSTATLGATALVAPGEAVSVRDDEVGDDTIGTRRGRGRHGGEW